MPNGLLTKDSSEIAPDKVTSDADGMKRFSVLISLIPSTALDTLTISSYLKHFSSLLSTVLPMQLCLLSAQNCLLLTRQPTTLSIHSSVLSPPLFSVFPHSQKMIQSEASHTCVNNAQMSNFIPEVSSKIQVSISSFPLKISTK